MVRMAEVAEDMVRRVKSIIADRDVEAAIELGRDDEIMDQLRRRSFTELLGDDWAHGVEAAVDIALLGRYYERIADHAVSVANRVVFVVTGEQISPKRRLTLGGSASVPLPCGGSLDLVQGLHESQRPWLATAAAAAAAASGSRYSPPGTVGARDSSRR